MRIIFSQNNNRFCITAFVRYAYRNSIVDRKGKKLKGAGKIPKKKSGGP